MLDKETRDGILERLNSIPDIVYHDTTERGFQQAITELARIVADLVDALAVPDVEAEGELDENLVGS